MRGWHERYEQAGLTVVGVHSPEFPWEKSLDNVNEAVGRLGIQYPVVQDNHYEIWQRFGVRAWPTIVRVDKKGIVRYSHVGEGAYDKTESMLKQLLAEPS